MPKTKQSPKKPGSPFKKVSKTISHKLLKNNGHELVVYGLEGTPIELYTYMKGLNDGYNNPLRQVINREKECPEMINDGFIAWFNRCISFRENETKRGPNGYALCVFIRYIGGGEVITTAETRTEGLNRMQWFLTNRDFFNFPVQSIEKDDRTGTITSMDRIIRDEDIYNFMRTIFAENLTPSFYLENIDIADKFYFENNFAHDNLELGYPAVVPDNIDDGNN